MPDTSSDQRAEYVAFSEEQLLRVIVYLGDRLRGGVTPLAEDAQDCIDWARHYLAEHIDGEKCPSCGAENPAHLWMCWSCHTALIDGKVSGRGTDAPSEFRS